MKKLFKYGSGLFLVGLFSIMMVSTASAQRGFHGGGGGGGMHLSGGGGGGFSGAFRGGSLNRATGVNSYRSGSGYFAGVGYHGGAFYRPGFGYYGYPHWGFYVGVLPFGYYPFYWGSDLYYYYGGVFYTPYDNGGYQVTAPPIGAGIPELPSNAQAIKIDGVQYYEANGVYYKETTDDKGKKIYVVAGRDGVLNTDANTTDPNAAVGSAAPQVGDIVNELPDGCHKVSLNGKKYYVSPNDIYYEKVTDPNGNVAFKIVSLPTPDDEKGA
jgi:hypothetical protein